MGNSVSLDRSPICISFSRVVASLPLFAAGQPCHSLLSQQPLSTTLVLPPASSLCACTLEKD